MIACKPENYGVGRKGCRVAYLVVHYTANNGDTAVNNCSYFANNAVQASCHYFVDEIGWQQSVAEADTAWHCGATRYVHKLCRNANSIGVELCSRRALNGKYYFLPETVENAQALVRELLRKYELDSHCVLRHYDVTGKVCPAPFVKDEVAWQSFLAGLMPREVPKPDAQQTLPSFWAEDAAQWAVARGLLRGDGAADYRWHEPVTREELAVILQRFQLVKNNVF